MANFAIKYLDKALDGVLDGIEHNVLDRVTSSLLDEFPTHDLSTLGPDYAQLQDAINFWRRFDMEDKKGFVEAAQRELSACQGNLPASIKRRADVAEAALSEVGGGLLEAADPTPLLLRMSDMGRALAWLQRENKKLQLDAQAAESEATTAIGITGRARELESANRTLKEQLAEEAERSAALQSELRTAQQASADSTRLAADLQTARNALSNLQADHEKVQSQLFELRTRQEEAAAVQLTDADLAARDLDAAHERLRRVTWEADQLQKRMEATAAGALEGPANPNRESMNDELLRVLRQELSEARAKLVEAENAAHRREEEHSVAAELAQQQLAAAQEECARRGDPAEMETLRSQVSALRSLVDAQMEAEGAEPEERSPEPSMLTPSSLHTILQARNRRLAAEAAELKGRLEEAGERSRQLADHVKELSAAKARQADLIAQLEDDLLHSSRPGLMPRKPTIASTASKGRSSAAAGQAGASEEGTPENDGDAGVGDASVGGVGSDADIGAEDGNAALVEILTGQRDRFRHRVQQLEDDVGAGQREMAGLKAKLSAAKADNVALYEKIRYLQRFGHRPADGGGIVVKMNGDGVPQEASANGLGHRFSCGPLELGLNVGPAPDEGLIPAIGGSRARGHAARRRIACFPVDDDLQDVEHGKSAVEQRYAKTYQAKLNPFAEFQQSEADLHVRKLAMHDRAILGGSKVLLASRVARVFAAVYLILIHAFIFALIYYAALSSTPVVLVPATGSAPTGVAKTLRRLLHLR